MKTTSRQAITFVALVVVISIVALIFHASSVETILLISILSIILYIIYYFKFNGESIRLENGKISEIHWSSTKSIDFNSLDNLTCGWVVHGGKSTAYIPVYGVYLEFDFTKSDGTKDKFTTREILSGYLPDVISKIKQVYPNVKMDDSVTQILAKNYDPKYKAY